MNPTSSAAPAQSRYNRFLLLVAGLGGLLFGVDVGIISGALPYLSDTSGLTGSQLSFIVAAVLLGSVISSLFAGVLADFIGRKPMMVASGVLFVLSVPVIALSHGYGALIFGRLLQGISGGLIGVGVPLYLAECLSASSRGKGTGIFQWMLTLGIVAAAIIGFYWSGRVDEVAKLGDPQKLFAFKDAAWRGIFWVSLPPGILFVLGAFMVSESPRWLFRKGNKIAARAALLRSRTEAQADIELREMEETAATEQAGRNAAGRHSESLFQRKYVLPFVLACIILACNQATGINSIIGYNTTIFIQAGLSDYWAHLGGVIQTIVNFLMTIVAVVLVDRKGRKFLLSVGSAGVIVSLLCIGLVFHKTETQRIDVKDAVQSMVISSNQTAVVEFNELTAATLLPAAATSSQPHTLVVIYSYGDFKAATKVVRSDVAGAKLSIDRSSCVPDTKVAAFFQNPFANLDAAQTAPLKIENAIITPVPSANNGWLTAALVYCFMAFFAMGPGVCVWLALSELMPTRIRSKGMSVALLINHCVSTAIAAFFLPTVGKYGYSTMFFIFAGCTVVYFITAAFFLPETKGKTLEEIEEHFKGKH
ncbi:MAG TPA: MFS transporter [Verrucomicrobiae bacterium]|nr:MFS transporter [Verrucomicrobiae bacterium]